MLPCGHPCGGFKGENYCLPCLKEDCANNNPELHGVNGDEYCNICFVEGLSAAPAIRSLKCGHIFHLHCMLKRLEVK